MFGLVAAMNTAFGNPQGNPEAIDWDRLRKQVQCIPEEVEEALEAIEQRDPKKLRDALCDVNVFSLGGHHLAGFDADKDMELVVSALMSRLVMNQDQLNRTAEKYHGLGLEVYAVGQFPAMALKSARDQTGSDGKFYPQHKFLKCVDFVEPVFD
jgi:hypothetical protein